MKMTLIKPALTLENKDFSYPIYVHEDALLSVGDFVKQAISEKKYSGCIIIADENVSKLYAGRLKGDLGESLKLEIKLPAGETTKSITHLEKICEQILASGIDRQTLIVALGGGVIGDLAGFAASILLRGIPFIQVPTSLLAMVDSSVGGKTGINSAAGKNLIGSFYQPEAVFIDTAVLNTLPKREFKAGYAEVVKYAFINDAKFFAWLEDNKEKIFALEPQAITHMITTCCQHKADIVAADEKEHGARALLNLGHTFGHALEAENNYGPELLHGEAVAIGMVMAFDFSAHLGICSAVDAEKVKTHIDRVGLPTKVRDIKSLRGLNAEKMISLMFKDKKVKLGRLRLILAHAIGESFVADEVKLDELQVFLEKTL
jgi:3-dehydroquinate synthase